VAQAVAECAFSTSPLPVALSLEMHCSRTQQHKLAKMLVKHLGAKLLTYDELCVTGRASTLSPHDLSGRVLAKGKIKPTKIKVRRIKKNSEAERSSEEDRGVSESCRSLSEVEARVSEDSGRRSSTGAKHSKMIIKMTSGLNLKFVRRRAQMNTTTPPDSERSERDADADEEVVTQTLSSARRESDMLRHNAEAMAHAVHKLEKSLRKRSVTKKGTDDFYGGILTLRSEPVPPFLADKEPKWPLPIVSINEDKLLTNLGIPKAERDLIEGLRMKPSPTIGVHGGHSLTEAQLSSRAIVRLALDPPPEVGRLQRRTARRLLRPFPLGLRFSGKNMSPQPGWLAGAQHVALNMSNIDIAVHLHFALFAGSAGFVLKPSEMNAVMPSAADVAGVENNGAHPQASFARNSASFLDKEAYWPPAREVLHLTTIEVLSLHQLPKRGEHRPSFEGSCSACHRYAPELSGTPAPPDGLNVSLPSVMLSLHPIGGFCAVSQKLPIPQVNETTHHIASVEANGMNATVGETVHCVAAEPHATFLCLRITDGNGRQEVAYESAVLGRLRRGYRIFRLRSTLGTRIELACFLVRIKFGTAPHMWTTPRQLRVTSKRDRDEIAHLKQQLESQQRVNDDGALGRNGDPESADAGGLGNAHSRDVATPAGPSSCAAVSVRPNELQ